MIKIRIKPVSRIAANAGKTNCVKHNSLSLEHNFYSGKISPDPWVGKIWIFSSIFQELGKIFPCVRKSAGTSFPYLGIVLVV